MAFDGEEWQIALGAVGYAIEPSDDAHGGIVLRRCTNMFVADVCQSLAALEMRTCTMIGSWHRGCNDSVRQIFSLVLDSSSELSRPYGA